MNKTVKIPNTTVQKPANVSDSHVWPETMIQNCNFQKTSTNQPGDGARDLFHTCAPHKRVWKEALLSGSLTFLKGSFAFGRSGQKMAWESSAGRNKVVKDSNGGSTKEVPASLAGFSWEMWEMFTDEVCVG